MTTIYSNDYGDYVGVTVSIFATHDANTGTYTVLLMKIKPFRYA